MLLGVRSLTWSQVHARRLGRNHLVTRAPAESLVDVARDVNGVQAQVGLAAELALAARVEGISRDDIREALWKRRTLVKAWTLRGTLHVHPAGELALWQAARRTTEYWREQRFLDLFGLTLDEAAAIVAAIHDALDGQALTRDELGDEVARRAGAWAKRETDVIQFGERALTWPQLLGAVPICQGPPRGRNVTFVRADQWVAGWDEPEPEAALAEAFRRYLRTYGPATPDEFAHWLYPRDVHDARRLVDVLGDELERVAVEGREAWQLAGDGVPRRDARSLRLVPDYDCYLIGAAPPGPQREAVVPAISGNRIFGGGAGPHASLLVDGVAAAVWKRKRAGKRLEVTVEPFRRLSAAERRGVEDEAARVAAFLGADEAALTFGQ